MGGRTTFRSGQSIGVEFGLEFRTREKEYFKDKQNNRSMIAFWS